MRYQSVRFLATAAVLATIAHLVGFHPAQPAYAQDSFMFLDVDSVDEQGDADNDIRNVVSAAASSYILNAINWTGDAVAEEDAGNPGSFPSWGQELSVRVTHDSSGHFADFQLGQNAFFFDDTYTGRQYSLYGTRVDPGDGLTFEFFENGDDFENLTDSIWTEITFGLESIADPVALPSLNAGSIRVDAMGRDSWPSNVILTGGPDGDINYGDFWGIEYAAGSTGPSITQVDIQLSQDGSLYFNPDQFFGQVFLSGDDSVGIDGGIGVVFDEQGVQLADSFSLMTLTFDPGDFTGGDILRFGVDIDANGIAQDDNEGFVDLNNTLFGGELPGSALAELTDGDVIITITFDDEQTVSGTLSDFGIGAADAGREVVTLFTDLTAPSALQTRFEADFDQDGDVDGDDFLVWQSNLGSQQATAEMGDADNDLDVDGNDFLIWQQQFGSAGGATGSPIPEPATLGMLGLLVAFAAIRRHRIATLVVACLIVAPLATPASAQDEFTLELVQSEGAFGDVFNDLRFVNSTASEAFVVNSVSWSGLVSPLPDPADPDATPPSWARDLSVRMTHDQSGAVAEFELGQGGFFDPGPVTFAGFEFSQLHGTTISPGDTFSLEFYEVTDHFAGSDAEWVNITFNLDPISGGVAPPAFAPGVIIADTTGINAFGTNLIAFPESDNFWGITYGVPTPAGGEGGGASPSITSVEIELSVDGSVWFDADQVLSPAVIGGDSVGIDVNPTIAFSEPGPQVGDSFRTATFTFEEGEFVGGRRLPVRPRCRCLRF